MTKRFLTTTVLATMALAGPRWASAQTATTDHDAHREATPPKPAAPTKPATPTKTATDKAATAKPAAGGAAPAGGMGMGMGTMGGDKSMCAMMGGGGMGNMGGGMGHMGGGMGAMMNMGGAGTQVAVKNTDKGVTITLTATDPTKVARLQKMAEAMRLMHEATAQ